MVDGLAWYGRNIEETGTLDPSLGTLAQGKPRIAALRPEGPPEIFKQ